MSLPHLVIKIKGVGGIEAYDKIDLLQSIEELSRVIPFPITQTRTNSYCQINHQNYCGSIK